MELEVFFHNCGFDNSFTKIMLSTYGLPSDATANLSNSASSLGPSYMQYAVKQRRAASPLTLKCGVVAAALWHCTILRPLAGNVKVGKTQNLIIQSKQSSPLYVLAIKFCSKSTNIYLYLQFRFSDKATSFDQISRLS